MKLLVTELISSWMLKSLQKSLGANSLGLLTPVGLGGSLLSRQTLEGVGLHSSSDGAHVGEERELAAASSAGGSSDDDGRHDEEWCKWLWLS